MKLWWPHREAEQAFLGGHMVVENHDLLGHVSELAQLVAGGGDVDECDQRILAIREANAVLVGQAVREAPVGRMVVVVPAVQAAVVRRQNR